MKNITTFDNLLLKTIHHLFTNWNNEHVGIVACCLKDGDKETFATSTKNGKNWLHAERNVYEKFNSTYGTPSENAAFIVTLSPCINPLKYRAEASCIELIKSIGIKRIHFGVLDTLHAKTLQDYSEKGFSASLTQDSNIEAICRKLMCLFDTYESRINSELSLIKKELGNTFFDSIMSLDYEQK